MVPYLLSEDQRLSLLFWVFCVWKGWHNISDVFLTKEFSMKMPSFSSIYFCLSLNILQIISTLPSNIKFYSVLYFKDSRNLAHLIYLFFFFCYQKPLSFSSHKALFLVRLASVLIKRYKWKVIFLNRSCREYGFVVLFLTKNNQWI